MSEERKSRYELFLEDEERAAQPTKRCPKCKEVRALSEYHKDRSSKDGLVSNCKKCIRAYQLKHCPPRYKSPEDRFWKFYHSHYKQDGACYRWTGSYGTMDYPQSWWNKKTILTARLAYELTNGAIPDNMVLLRTCEHRWCVRVSHMKLASRLECETKRANHTPYGDDHYSRKSPDRLAHGSRNGAYTQPHMRPHGIRHGCAKLNEDDIRWIRTAYANGVSEKDIANTVGVSTQHIDNIVKYRNWKHVE